MVSAEPEYADVNAWELLEQYQSQNPEDPQGAWRQARIARNRGAGDPQALADAEHNLWAQYYASKSLPKAIAGMGGPAVHHAKKYAHKLLGLPDASETTAQQFNMGMMGAWAGLKKQLEQANLLRMRKQ